MHHDFAGGGLRRPEYLALNPNGMVPTLVDGAFILWELNAIMQYLADKAGNDALFPRDPAGPRRRACAGSAGSWRISTAPSARSPSKPSPSRALNFGPADASLVADGAGGSRRFAPVLEGHLAGRRVRGGRRNHDRGLFDDHFRGLPRQARAVRLGALPAHQRLFRPHAAGRAWVRTDPAKPCFRRSQRQKAA